MKAARYEKTGPARDVLEVTETERPEPGPGEVRVRIHASGLNPTDVKARSGAVPRPIDGFQIPGMDGAGIIDKLGAGVDPARNGQRVWLYFAAAGRRWGTEAEWTVVPADLAVPLPSRASMELGATMGVPALTAHHCVFADGPVTGQTVLVQGGAGAVGHFAIEWAKRGGARVVTTVSGAEKADLARAAGADLVVNYREGDVPAQVRPFAEKVDRIIEVALGPNLDSDLALAHPGTVIMTYAADGPDPVLPVRPCMGAGVVLRFMLLYTVPRATLAAGAADITAALAEGALTPLPPHRFLLDDAVAAHEAVENGVGGKVFVIPAREV
ncbi:MAG: NADPH:quinone reductase [Actinobacteria bacterium]|nr:NADPH:quinone reductase [Actinomycetota bacterium]